MMRENPETPDLELKALSGFSGSENYFNVLGKNVTDGIKYVMDNGYAWLVTDALAAILCKAELRAEEFLVVKLKVDVKNHTADMTIDDGNDNVLYRQHYAYTNAKRAEVKLYFENSVLCLPSER